MECRDPYQDPNWSVHEGRNYDYDRFWVTFPLTREDGSALFGDADRVAQLIVRIMNKEGRVEWPVPASLRASVR